jgi:hypothetical protein
MNAWRKRSAILVAALASAYTLALTTPEFSAGSVVPVEVSTNGVDFDNTFLSFMFVNPVTVTSVTPNVSTSNRLSVVVIGNDFVRTQLLKCFFGPDIYSDAVFVSSTAVKCAQPPDLSCEYCIAVSLNAYQFSATCARILIVPLPSIFTVVPSVASPLGASVVFLNGSIWIHHQLLEFLSIYLCGGTATFTGSIYPGHFTLEYYEAWAAT